jgi:peptidoglycan-N-acetylglucosamine deacetylase
MLTAAVSSAGMLSAMGSGAPPPARPAAKPAPPAVKAVPLDGRPRAVRQIAGPGALATLTVNCQVRKCVALTFDDGPMGEPTSRLLDILGENHIKATFFVVGQNVIEFPSLMHRLQAEGHEIANHSYRHTNLGSASKQEVRSEIGQTQAAVQQTVGILPRLFRPPYGSTNATVAAVAREHRLAQILWSLDTHDWQYRSSRQVESRTLKGARPGGIVLMHDIHATTVAAVPAIIRALSAKGYVFVTVSELYRGKPLKPGNQYPTP